MVFAGLCRPTVGLYRILQTYFRSLQAFSRPTPGLCRLLQAYSRSLQASVVLTQVSAGFCRPTPVFCLHWKYKVHVGQSVTICPVHRPYLRSSTCTWMLWLGRFDLIFDFYSQWMTLKTLDKIIHQTVVRDMTVCICYNLIYMHFYINFSQASDINVKSCSSRWIRKATESILEISRMVYWGCPEEVNGFEVLGNMVYVCCGFWQNLIAPS